MVRALDPVSGVASAQGLDVSNFQGRFDWAGTKRGYPALAFGIHRLTEGLPADRANSPDPDAAWNHQEIAAAGLHRGAYHFLHPLDDGAAQARYFVDTASKLGAIKPDDMFWLDTETEGVSPASTAAVGRAFMAELHQLLPHNPMGVYTYINFARQGNCAGLGIWPSWIAYPAAVAPVEPPPWTVWKFWQWGERNGIDADAFNGTAAQLASWLATFAPKPPSAGPFRHVTDGSRTLGEIAQGRSTSVSHLLSESVSHYTPADLVQLAGVKAAGVPYYTSNP